MTEAKRRGNGVLQVAQPAPAMDGKGYPFDEFKGLKEKPEVQVEVVLNE